MNKLVCYMILVGITSRASEDVKKLWVIEGNRIELQAPSAVHKVTSVGWMNWFYDNGTHVNNIIVSLENPKKGPFSINCTDGGLIIEPVNRAHAGYYTFQVVEKDETTSWESTSYLVVYYMDPPIISTYWNANENNRYIFCSWSRINPDNETIVRWFIDGSELNTTKDKFISFKSEVNRKATLTILNISKKDFGNHTCSITVNTNVGVMNKVSKGLHTTDDRKALIKGVLIANVLEGSSQVTMPCEYSAAEGNVETILWNEVDDSGKNINVAITNSAKKVNGRYKLMTESGVANLTIEFPTRDDSGRRFKCLVIFENKPPAILDPPTQLNVLYLDKPELTVSPSDIYEGQSFTLTCSNINGNPPTPIHVTWLKDNIIISNDSSRYEIYEDFKRLRMPVASVNESGNYQCRVENEENAANTSLNLNISVIKFYLNQPNVTSSQSVVYEGNSFTLTCNNINANTPSPIQVTWLKDNIIISNDSSRYEIYEDLNRIRIPFASVYDSGNYQCRVENDADREGKTSLKLNISILKCCVSDLQYTISTMVLISATFTALVLGSFPTFLMCHYIRKRREREIHRQYQTLQYKALEFRPTSSVYKELNKVNDDTSSTAKNDTNAPSAVIDKTCAFDNSIYEDVKY